MNSTYLNAKCKGILRKLLNNNSYLSLQKLAEELNISQRSIYYDVCRINEWLSENDIPELRVVRGKGLLLSEQVRIQIAECMEEKNYRGGICLFADGASADYYLQHHIF